MRRFRVFCLLVFLPTALHAQEPRDIRQGNADYPMPTPLAVMAMIDGIPAYVEPSSVRYTSFAARGVWGNSPVHCAAGAEFAPILLGSGIDLSDYLKGRLLRVALRTRVSIAAEMATGSGFLSSLGLRWMLHDDADLRADSLFQRRLVDWARQDRSLMGRCGSDTISSTGIACLTETIARAPDFQERIDSLRTAMKEKLWNRSVWETGVAALYRSVADDHGRIPLMIRRYAGFMSAAFPQFGTSGRLDFGVTGSVGYSDSPLGYQRQGAVFLRTYLGSPSERTFAGVALVAQREHTPDYRFDIGGLSSIANGVWLRAEFGVSLEKHPERGPEASLILSFGTPEINRP